MRAYGRDPGGKPDAQGGARHVADRAAHRGPTTSRRAAGDRAARSRQDRRRESPPMCWRSPIAAAAWSSSAGPLRVGMAARRRDSAPIADDGRDRRAIAVGGGMYPRVVGAAASCGTRRLARSSSARRSTRATRASWRDSVARPGGDPARTARCWRARCQPPCRRAIWRRSAGHRERLGARIVTLAGESWAMQPLSQIGDAQLPRARVDRRARPARETQAALREPRRGSRSARSASPCSAASGWRAR